MFGKKDKKLELVKEMLGTRAAYAETIKDLDLTEDEKTLFMRASSQVKKENPDSAVITEVYSILTEMSGKEKNISQKALDESSKIADGVKKTIEENTPTVEESIKKASNRAANESQKIAQEVIQNKKINFKYIAIASVAIGLYFFINGSLDRKKAFENREETRHESVKDKKIAEKVHKRNVAPMHTDRNKAKITITAAKGDPYWNYEPGHYSFKQECSYYSDASNYKGKYKRIHKKDYIFGDAFIDAKATKATGSLKYKVSCGRGEHTGWKVVGKDEIRNYILDNCKYMPYEICTPEHTLHAREYQEAIRQYFTK